MHHRRSCQALTGIPQPHPDHQTAGDRKGQGTMLLHPIDEQHGLTTSKLVAVLTPRCFALCRAPPRPESSDPSNKPALVDASRRSRFTETQPHFKESSYDRAPQAGVLAAASHRGAGGARASRTAMRPDHRTVGDQIGQDTRCSVSSKRCTVRPPVAVHQLCRWTFPSLAWLRGSSRTCTGTCRTPC